MIMWQKIKNIQIPGNIWVPLLTGALLGTTMVLFTRLPIAPTTVRTLEENTSGKNESLEILITLPDGEKLLLRATGETTTEVLTNLKQMLSRLDGTLLLERSSVSIPRQEGLTTRRPANYF